MTAALNVFGNVREYDADLDVFGNVWEWEAATVTEPTTGWTAKTRSRLLIAESRSRVSIPVSRDRVWKTEQR